ncbi:phage shock protein E [Alteromonadaceae bacterium Bs31]|nr:phage shock protein E [Alteromonadaceae bacterium Bs31]
MADDKEIWIDVRSANEYSGGAYNNAINIPHDIIDKKIAEVSKDKNASIHVYCRSGNRSGIAKGVLEKMGYTNVVNEGGYEDLLKRAK